MPDRLYATRNVDIAQYHTAENRAVRIRVPRHHRQPYRRIAFLVFHNLNYRCTQINTDFSVSQYLDSSVFICGSFLLLSNLESSAEVRLNARRKNDRSFRI